MSAETPIFVGASVATNTLLQVHSTETGRRSLPHSPARPCLASGLWTVWPVCGIQNRRDARSIGFFSHLESK